MINSCDVRWTLSPTLDSFFSLSTRMLLKEFEWDSMKEKKTELFSSFSLFLLLFHTQSNLRSFFFQIDLLIIWDVEHETLRILKRLFGEKWKVFFRLLGAKKKSFKFCKKKILIPISYSAHTFQTIYQFKITRLF